MPEHGVITAGESTLDRLTGRAEDIAEKIQVLTEQLNTFTGAENQKKIIAVVDHIDQLVLSATGTIEENRPAVRELAATLKEAGSRVNSAVAILEVETTGAARALRQVSERVRDEVEPNKIRSIVNSVEKISTQVRGGVDAADLPAAGAQFKDLLAVILKVARNLDTTVLRGRESIFASLSYLQETLENLSEFSRQIRENPSLLLGGAEEKERKL